MSTQASKDAARAALERLRGRWRLRRTIVDRLARGDANRAMRARLDGVADLVDDGAGGLVHVERGTLRLPGARMAAARRYGWRVEADGDDATRLRLDFDDGRPLARFAAAALERGGRVCARHLCGRDVYDGALAFDAPDDARGAWRLAWRVNGPRKDMTIVSVFFPT